jgi:hypothetical protein
MAKKTKNSKLSTVISLGIIIFGGFVWYNASAKPGTSKPKNLTVVPESEEMITEVKPVVNQAKPKIVAPVATEAKPPVPIVIAESDSNNNTNDTPLVLANDSTAALEIKPSDDSSEIPDTFEPILYNIEAVEITDTTAVIQWTTREPATGKIFIGNKTPLNLKTASSMKTTTLDLDHVFELGKLIPNTKYYFVLESVDAAGNVGTSIETPFKTAPKPGV